MASCGRGFVLDVGDPSSARIAIALETPATEEVGFSVMPPPAGYGQRQVLGTIAEGQREALRRSAAFPNVPAHLRGRGVPVVGRTGSLLNRLLRAAGIDRDSLYISNVIRCFPPKSKKGDNFPTGHEKNIAQSMCRQYDLIGEGPGKFFPDIIVVTMHPAALFKDGASSAEPLILADLEKAASFARDGHKVLVLMGGHAADVFLGYGTNVSKFRGDYHWTAPLWYSSRVEKLHTKAEKSRRAGMPRVKAKTKVQVARELLARRIMDRFLELGILNTASATACQQGFEEIVAALTPLPKMKRVKVDASTPEAQ